MGGAPSTLPNISDITLQTASNANIDGNTVHTTSVPATARNTSTHLRPNEKEIIKLMLPVYYLHVDASPDEIKIASDSWELILNDKSPEFLKRKENDTNFQYGSCMIFFYDSFYTRLFDMHPICRPLFLNGIKIQGRFLVKMLSLSLSVYQDPVKFDHALLKLAEGHYHGGVKSVEYGIVGEVLFWALRNVLGAAYTFELHTIWVKIYSRMLRTIVPAAVAFELKGETEKQLVRPHRRDSHLFPMESLTKPEENPTESTIPQSPTSEKKVDTIRLSQGIEVMSVEYTPMQLALL